MERSRAMSVLSIQSQVSYGRVGNRVAAFALERLGHDVWPVDTVQLSNHPAFGSHTGRVVPAAEVRALITGIAARGAFDRCAAVLSGYLGDPDTGPVVLDAVAMVKAQNPDARFCLGAVMGAPDGGLYVDAALPAFFRDYGVPAADIVIGNAFEIGLLAGGGAETLEDAREAAAALIDHGPGLVVVTGLLVGAELITLAVTAEAAWSAASPTVEAPAFGAGDLLAALLLGRLLEGAPVPEALSLAVGGLEGVFAETARRGDDSLALIAAQDELGAPSRRPPARPMGGA